MILVNEYKITFTNKLAMKQKFLKSLYTSDLQKIAKKFGINSVSKTDRETLIDVLSAQPYKLLTKAYNESIQKTIGL